MYDDDDDDWDKKSLRRFMKPNFKKHISKLQNESFYIVLASDEILFPNINMHRWI